MDPKLVDQLPSALASLGEPVTTPTNLGGLWPILDHLRKRGAVVVIKLDGERVGDEAKPFTVVVSGGPLNDDYVTTEAATAEDAIGVAIIRCGDALRS